MDDNYVSEELRKWNEAYLLFSLPSVIQWGEAEQSVWIVCSVSLSELANTLANTMASLSTDCRFPVLVLTSPPTCQLFVVIVRDLIKLDADSGSLKTVNLKALRRMFNRLLLQLSHNIMRRLKTKTTFT